MGNAVNEAWSHVVCPGCACVCDDIALQRNDAGSVTFEPHCDLGRTWFQKYAQRCQVTATVEGQPVDPSAAMNRAAEILNSADYLLIYGLSRSSTPGQRAAIMLAEQLRGVVDTTASLCHGPSIMALQEAGEVTSTLGEVRRRADLVIFWGCNPADSHPRHAERYSVFPDGRLLPGGRSDRKVVMIGSRNEVNDWRLDSEGSRPDLVIALEPDGDFDALSQLRLLLNDSCCDYASAELRLLMDLMRACRYGVVFFGLGLAETAMWSGTLETGSTTLMPIPDFHQRFQLRQRSMEFTRQARSIAWITCHCPCASCGTPICRRTNTCFPKSLSNVMVVNWCNLASYCTPASSNDRLSPRHHVRARRFPPRAYCQLGGGSGSRTWGCRADGRP